MTSIRFSRQAAAVLLMLGLAACSRHEKAEPPRPAPAPASAPAPAPDKERERALMLAIFGKEYDPGTDKALAVIKDEGEDGYFLMTLDSSTELPDGRTMVSVNGSPSDENRGDQSGHASPGMLNVYALRREGAQWKLVERHENVASMGSSGYFGSVKWVTLGPGKPGMIVSSGGTWQGYTVSEAGIFELGQEVRMLGGFSEASSSGGACVAGMDDCWDVDSSIRFVDNPQGGAYRDILVDFKGRHYTVTEGKDGNDVEHLKSTVRQSARYHYDGKEYVLVSGANPVPGV
jgi:hypothetical protein